MKKITRIAREGGTGVPPVKDFGAAISKMHPPTNAA